MAALTLAQISPPDELIGCKSASTRGELINSYLELVFLPALIVRQSDEIGQFADIQDHAAEARVSLSLRLQASLMNHEGCSPANGTNPFPESSANPLAISPAKIAPSERVFVQRASAGDQTSGPCLDRKHLPAMTIIYKKIARPAGLCWAARGSATERSMYSAKGSRSLSFRRRRQRKKLANIESANLLSNELVSIPMNNNYFGDAPALSTAGGLISSARNCKSPSPGQERLAR